MTTAIATPPTESRTDPVAGELARLLADTYLLYLKTHGYHWNVSGPSFAPLHLLFEQQYLELREVVDEIAERIRARGPMAPGSYRQLARLATIEEDESVPEAATMVRRLARDQEILGTTARAVLRAAEAADDPATVDLATRRIAAHEKAGWMLRATLGEEAGLPEVAG